MSLDIHKVKEELLTKIRGAASARVGQVRSEQVPNVTTKKVKQRNPGSQLLLHERAIVIGSSTGGPAALNEIIPRLPADLPAAVLVVQHMPAGFTKSFAQRLDRVSELSVKEAESDDPLKTGQVLVAPGDYHMIIGKGGFVKLDRGPRLHGVRPAVDVTLKSAAETLGRRCVGVILTGMGSDGRDGCAAIKASGGVTLAEDEASCVVFGMPGSVIKAGLADRVVPLSHMAEEIMALL